MMQFRYSMINTFLECPLKWHRQYILKQGEEGKSSALEFGTAMHLALEALLEGDDPYTTFEVYWNSLLEHPIEYDRFSWDDLKVMALESFIPNFKRMHLKKLETKALETTVEMPFLGEHTLQGTFDWAGNYEGKLTIADWKTSSREYNSFKIHRNPQMYIYAALYKHKFGVLPEQIMYKVFIKSERRIQTQKLALTQDSVDAMVKNVEAICRNLLWALDTGTIYSNYNSCYCTNLGGCFK